MAGEVVDSLVIATHFDESGLDRSTAAALNRIQRFTAGVEQAARSLPEITLSTAPAEQSLDNLGAAFDRFIGEARDLEAFPNFTTEQAQREIAELLAEFPGLEKALLAVDPSGVFRVMAQQAQTAASEIQKTAELQRQAAVEISRTVAAAGTRGSANDPAAVAGAQRLSQAEQQLAQQITQTRVASTLAAQRLNEMSAAEAQAGIAALKAGGQMQVQARAIAIAKQQEAQAHRLAAASAQAGVPIAQALTQGYIAQTQAAQRLAAQNVQAARSVDAVAAAMSRASSGALAWAQGAAQINAQNSAVATSGMAAGKGLDRVRAGLTRLALSASGTSPAVGQVVSGLLLLGGGSVVVLGVAAGMAIIATAFNLIEAPTRKAREETDELLRTLERARISRLPAFAQIGLQIEDVRQRMVATTERVQRFQAIIAENQAMAGGAFRQGQLDKELATLSKLTEEMAELVRLRASVQVEQGNALIRDLSIQAATFGQTATEAKRLAIALDTSLTPAQRKAATAVLDTLIQLERQKKAAEQAAAVLGKVGFVIPETFLELPDITLTPRVDNTEALAAVERLQAAFRRGLGDDEIERARRAAIALADALAGVELSLKDIGDASKLTRADAMERLSDSIQDVTRGLDQVAGAAANVGLIGDEAGRAIGSVLDLGDAISQVIKQASTGNILGLVGAGINVLGGLFGGGESEHDRIVRENTEAIRRNTAAQSSTFAGIGGQSLLASEISRVLDAQAAGIPLPTAGAPEGFALPAEILEAQFRFLGITIGDLEVAADRFGISITKDGLLVTGALQQLEDAILADVQAGLQFQKTLDEFTLRDDLRARITGAALDPTTAFQRKIDAAGELGATEISQFFEGIDLGDPDALRKASLGLLDAFEQGQLDAAKLGKLSREDILRILGDAAGLIESLGESALDAANELSIVPRGFRNAALAFEAQIPDLSTAIPPTLRPVDVPLATVAIDGTDALDRLIPQPIQITGADLLDRLVAIGAIPATTALPPTVPGDGAALPQIAASLTSSGSVLAQIAATLSAFRPDTPELQTTQRETNAVLVRLSDLLSKAKIGQQFGDVFLQIENDGKEPHELVRDIGRALDDLRMADLGRTDPLRSG